MMQNIMAKWILRASGYPPKSRASQASCTGFQIESPMRTAMISGNPNELLRNQRSKHHLFAASSSIPDVPPVMTANLV
jgi:hypothetical protein